MPVGTALRGHSERSLGDGVLVLVLVLVVGGYVCMCSLFGNMMIMIMMVMMGMMMMMIMMGMMGMG